MKLSRSLAPSLSHSFSISLMHFQHAEQLLFSCPSSKVTLSVFHSLTLDILNNFCFHVNAQKSLSHSLIHSFTHSRHAEQFLFSCLCSKVTLSLLHFLTLSISHSLTLNMLNNFCFHVYAQKSLFIGENDNDYFWPSSSPLPVSEPLIELVPS